MSVTTSAEGQGTKSLSLTECSICFDTFKNPKCLPCIHTFCLECLKTFGHNELPGNQMSCPLCRADFTIPPKGFEELPRNFFIEQILLEVNALPNMKLEDNDEGICELCGDGSDTPPSAVNHCVECRQDICEKCELLHRKQKYGKDHRIITLKKKKTLRSEPEIENENCVVHPEERYKLYCHVCNEAVCLMCFAINHNGHKCSSIEESSEKFKSQLESSQSQVVVEIKDIKDQLEQLGSEKNEYLNRISDCEQMIQKRCDELKALIDTHRNKLFEELSDAKYKELKQVELIKEEFERHLQSLVSFNKCVEDLVKSGSPCSVTRAANTLLVECGHILERRVTLNRAPIPNVEFCLATIHEVDNLIGKLNIKNENEMTVIPPEGSVPDRISFWQEWRERHASARGQRREERWAARHSGRGETFVPVTGADTPTFVSSADNEQNMYRGWGHHRRGRCGRMPEGHKRCHRSGQN